MLLVVGLGNPGKTYENTFHNIGFLAVSSLAKKYSAKFKKEGLSSVATFFINGEKIVLAQPQTFMNESGKAVLELVKKYKIDLEKDFILVYDDVDLNSGKIRIRNHGSAGTHNGVKSVVESIGSDFLRVRVGFGPKNNQLLDFVLKNIPKQSEVFDGISKSVDACCELIERKPLEKVMQTYSE